MTDADRTRAYRSFFCDLNRGTSPDLIPELDIAESAKAERTLVVQRTSQALVHNVVLRARRPGRSVGPPDRADVPDSDVALLSALMLRLFRDHFGAEDSELALEDVRQAFEMFANGELRVNDPILNCEPDSAYYFCYAEFALLAMEREIDRDAWKSLLEIFVSTQRIFMQAYRPTYVGEHLFNEYHLGNRNPAKRVDEAEKRGLWNEFRGASVEDLVARMGQHCLLAFPGEAARA